MGLFFGYDEFTDEGVPGMIKAKINGARDSMYKKVVDTVFSAWGKGFMKGAMIAGLMLAGGVMLWNMAGAEVLSSGISTGLGGVGSLIGSNWMTLGVVAGLGGLIGGFSETTQRQNELEKDNLELRHQMRTASAKGRERGTPEPECEAGHDYNNPDVVPPAAPQSFTRFAKNNAGKNQGMGLS